MEKVVCKKRIIKILVCILICTSMVISNVYTVMANTRVSLEDKLNEQTEDLKNELEGKIDLSDDTILGDLSDGIANTPVNGTSNIKEVARDIQTFINKAIVESRTISIIIYGLIVVVLLIYMGTIGSRSLTNRRHAFLLLIGFSILFLVYINIPLAILYFTADKSGMAKVSLYTRVLDLIDFFKSNSLIIALLLGYVGITKIIISKQDLPTRMQGKYLIKFGIILLIMLNIIPIAVNFIL